MKNIKRFAWLKNETNKSNGSLQCRLIFFLCRKQKKKLLNFSHIGIPIWRSIYSMINHLGRKAAFHHPWINVNRKFVLFEFDDRRARCPLIKRFADSLRSNMKCEFLLIIEIVGDFLFQNEEKKIWKKLFIISFLLVDDKFIHGSIFFRLVVDFDLYTGKYYPVLYLNDYWNLLADYYPVNNTFEYGEIHETSFSMKWFSLFFSFFN